MNVNKLHLWQLKILDINCFYLSFHKDSITNYLNCDILLHIISYLGINKIIKLKKVCKIFYGLCRSNYVWGPILFNVIDSSPSEKMMKIIYEQNKYYFLNYFC